MGSPAIQAEHVCIADLCDRAQNWIRLCGPADTLPIPAHVATAQTNNPYSRPDDIALIVLTSSNRPVGYVGVLPGRLSVDGEQHPITYSSSMFLSPEFRGQGLGRRLFDELESLPVDILNSSLSADARRLLVHRGTLDTIGPRTDIMLDLRFLRSGGRRVLAASASMPGLRALSSRAQARYQTGGYFLSRRAVYRLLQASSRRSMTVEATEVDQLPATAFDAPPEDRPHLVRGREWINWRLRHPWILNTRDTAERYENFFFRAVQPLFRLFAVTFRSRPTGEDQGFVVLSVSDTGIDTTLKLLESGLSPAVDKEAVARWLISRYGARYNVDRVYMSGQFGDQFLRSPVWRPFTSSVQHHYYARPSSATSPLARALSRLTLDPSDGDMPFT